ncbi:MAG: DNA methyltransferase [bacterium]|nr:DNA methyltransferase [bacterium]
MNTLYYGDNLDILRRYLKDETVDLVYLDPPFKSNQDYNVLFQEQNGSRSAAQIKAFGDTWRWDRAAAEAYEEVVEAGGPVSRAMQAFRTFLGENDMLAYLSMMAPRLMELHRVLKPTGSIYLHCDPTASHYLKMLMDAVFGPAQFRNEIIWERTVSHNIRTKGYVRANDTILYYSKTTQFVFNDQYTAYGPEQMRRYKPDETGRLYKAENLTFSSPNLSRQFEWRGAKPPPYRSWGASLEQLEEWYAQGRILLKQDGTPRLDGLKVYLDETKGKPVSTNWADIPRIGNTSAERLGYPTQKPEALLERIVAASTNEGDTVLDPFCGCGTTVAAAQKLKRRWIGIDITHLAITLIKHRLYDAFGDRATYKVIGEPVSLPDAQDLAVHDPYQFQWWALGLVGARPVEQKKGADRGIDGRLYFHDEGEGGKTKQIILSVKAGNVTVAHVRDLRGVLDREKAEIGVLISMEEPTKQMRAEVAGAGFYLSPVWGRKHPRLQVLTVAELLEGKRIDYPPSGQVNVTFKKAPKAKAREAEQLTLAAEDKAEYRTKGR